MNENLNDYNKAPKSAIEEYNDILKTALKTNAIFNRIIERIDEDAILLGSLEENINRINQEINSQLKKRIKLLQKSGIETIDSDSHKLNLIDTLKMNIEELNSNKRELLSIITNQLYDEKEIIELLDSVKTMQRKSETIFSEKDKQNFYDKAISLGRKLGYESHIKLDF